VSGKPCPPNCTCGKHFRTKAHNYRIGVSVALTAEAKRKQRTGLDLDPPRSPTLLGPYWDHP
jgi:hypothetical protein